MYPENGQEETQTVVGTHGSSQICTREWNCLASIGRKALCPEKAQFPSVEECQGGEMGVGGCEGDHPHRGRERCYGRGMFLRGKWKRG